MTELKEPLDEIAVVTRIARDVRVYGSVAVVIALAWLLAPFLALAWLSRSLRSSFGAAPSRVESAPPPPFERIPTSDVAS